MNNCRSIAKRKTTGGCVSPAAGKWALRRIVSDYLATKAPAEARYLQFYKIQKNITDAITKASMAELPSGKKFAHQHRIPHAVLIKAKDALLKEQSQIRGCRNFDELFEVVNAVIGGIVGVGELMIYDTAHRFGAFLEMSPEYVYLHAGAREGAQALGLVKLGRKLEMSRLPKELRLLKPEQVEDCLCIYKKHF